MENIDIIENQELISQSSEDITEGQKRQEELLKVITDKAMKAHNEKKGYMLIYAEVRRKTDTTAFSNVEVMQGTNNLLDGLMTIEVIKKKMESMVKEWIKEAHKQGKL